MLWREFIGSGGGIGSAPTRLLASQMKRLRTLEHEPPISPPYSSLSNGIPQNWQMHSP